MKQIIFYSFKWNRLLCLFIGKIIFIYSNEKFFFLNLNKTSYFGLLKCNKEFFYLFKCKNFFLIQVIIFIYSNVTQFICSSVTIFLLPRRVEKPCKIIFGTPSLRWFWHDTCSRQLLPSICFTFCGNTTAVLEFQQTTAFFF